VLESRVPGAVSPWIIVEFHWRFEEEFCHHPQGIRLSLTGETKDGVHRCERDIPRKESVPPPKVCRCKNVLVDHVTWQVPNTLTLIQAYNTNLANSLTVVYCLPFVTSGCHNGNTALPTMGCYATNIHATLLMWWAYPCNRSTTVARQSCNATIPSR
jgi:hypothetical protein